MKESFRGHEYDEGSLHSRAAARNSKGVTLAAAHSSGVAGDLCNIQSQEEAPGDSEQRALYVDASNSTFADEPLADYGWMVFGDPPLSFLECPWHLSKLEVVQALSRLYHHFCARRRYRSSALYYSMEI